MPGGFLDVSGFCRFILGVRVWTILIDTGHVTARLILSIAAAAKFSRVLAIRGLPSAPGNWVSAQKFTRLSVMLVHIAVALFLGAAYDPTSMMLISVPIFKAPGADLVWVGIITMIKVEVGLITPPFGVSRFVVKVSFDKDGLARNISLSGIYMGALPFPAAALLAIALIVAFPMIALILV